MEQVTTSGPAVEVVADRGGDARLLEVATGHGRADRAGASAAPTSSGCGDEHAARSQRSGTSWFSGCRSAPAARYAGRRSRPPGPAASVSASSANIIAPTSRSKRPTPASTWAATPSSVDDHAGDLETEELAERLPPSTTGSSPAAARTGRYSSARARAAGRRPAAPRATARQLAALRPATRTAGRRTARPGGPGPPPATASSTIRCSSSAPARSATASAPPRRRSASSSSRTQARPPAASTSVAPPGNGPGRAPSADVGPAPAARWRASLAASSPATGIGDRRSSGCWTATIPPGDLAEPATSLWR